MSTKEDTAFEAAEKLQQKVSELADLMPKALPYGIREAMAELKVGDYSALRRVPEPLFIRDILPVLTGEQGKFVDFKWWGFRFGSAFKGFLIVDVNDQVLFEVPALLDRNFKLVAAKNPRDTVPEAAARYKQRVYDRPGIARRDMHSALAARLDFSEVGRPMKHMQMLDKIFIHYGKPSIFEQTDNPLIREEAGTAAKESGPAPVAESNLYNDQDFSDEGMLD